MARVVFPIVFTFILLFFSFRFLLPLCLRVPLLPRLRRSWMWEQFPFLLVNLHLSSLSSLSSLAYLLESTLTSIIIFASAFILSFSLISLLRQVLWPVTIIRLQNHEVSLCHSTPWNIFIEVLPIVLLHRHFSVKSRILHHHQGVFACSSVFTDIFSIISRTCTILNHLHPSIRSRIPG